ncbi:M23 family metallopeptidase [Paenarthrobacter sp. JL.01a]|uniref:M23 family metallopeptidase n=1 Tax=Paenarthrobacter sp. JL.01a TaxID=2979324 RepID=UPI0021C9D989|nr:M23 family metallopeptidase [Paenarthrobacter sp. JL.01a]UXM90957.1 M23 family metallopeptidase [Paenarthrobacter sp. JL.01a]
MRWPVDAPVSQAFGSNPTNGIRPGSPDYWIIQQFGNYQPNGHTGVDFSVPIGTPVAAAGSGTVLHEGWMGGTYADNPWWIAPAFAGICVVIDHGSFIGIYGHMSSTSVNKGDFVTEGEVIGLSGNTGGSTGPHLHFEVLPDGWDFNNGMYGRVNPAAFISANAAMGPAGEVTTIPTPTEEDDMFTDNDRAVLTAVSDAIFKGGQSTHKNKSLNNMLGSIWDAIFAGGASMPGGKSLSDILGKVAEAPAVTVDPAALAASIAESIPADLAAQVADELGKRLQGGK